MVVRIKSEVPLFKSGGIAEKAFALPEVKGLLMEAVNEHNKNEFGGD